MFSRFWVAIIFLLFFVDLGLKVPWRVNLNLFKFVGMIRKVRWRAALPGIVRIVCVESLQSLILR